MISPTPQPTNARTIFVVDDDAALVESLAELLIDEGYRVEAFTRPDEALARLGAGARPSALLLDYLMPDMTGAQFLAALAQARVEVPVLLLSGASDPRVDVQVAAVLPKPFDVDRLLVEIERLIGAGP